MIRKFAGNNILILFFLPFLPLSNLVAEYYYPTLIYAQNIETNLWGLSLQNSFNWLLGMFAIILIVGNAILLNGIFNRHEFYSKNTYLPSLIYVSLTTFFPYSVYLNGELFAQTFLILMVFQLFRLRQNEDGRSAVFLGALFLGMAITLNSIYLFVIPFLWMSIARIRPFVLREYLLSLLGLLTPFSYLFFVNQNFLSKIFQFDAVLNYKNIEGYFIWILYLLLLILIIFCYLSISRKLPKSTIRYKRLLSVVLYVLAFTIIISLITNYFFDTIYYFASGSISLAFILPYAYLESKAQKFTSIIILLLILLSYFKFFPI